MQRNQTLFLKDLPKNMFSGFVVSLIALPLGLGLALASGAPPIAGVLTAVVGGIVVSILGGSHVTISGPGNGLVIVVLGA
ncbi:MAG: SulP family inorganic anion transporter, partial [Flavobacteriaceae bacterium]